MVKYTTQDFCGVQCIPLPDDYYGLVHKGPTDQIRRDIYGYVSQVPGIHRVNDRICDTDDIAHVLDVAFAGIQDENLDAKLYIFAEQSMELMVRPLSEGDVCFVKFKATYNGMPRMLTQSEEMLLRQINCIKPIQ